MIRTTRILFEICKITNHPHFLYKKKFFFDINIKFWKIVMYDPSKNIYKNGGFVLYLDMEKKNYPLFPPKVHVLTEILHPNINKQGKICRSILDRKCFLDFRRPSVANISSIIPQH